MEAVENILTSVQTLDTLKCVLLFVIVAITTKYAMALSWTIPGPWGFPLVGHLPLLAKGPVQQFQKYKEQYGDIYQIRLGAWPTIIISGSQTVKKVLSEQSDSFAARPAFYSFKHITQMKGLTFSHFDKRYIVHKRIASTIVRQFSGTKYGGMEEILQNEANLLVDELLQENGEPFDPHKACLFAAGSVIYQFCYGKGENAREDDGFLHFMDDFKTFKEMAMVGNVSDVLPWIRIFFKKKLQKFLQFVSSSREDRLQKTKEIRKTFDPEHLRHAVDGLIANTQKFLLGEEPDENGLTEHDVLNTTGDFFGGGFDTVTTTLLWLFLYMAEYPEIQHKIQHELEEKVGSRGTLFLKDRSDLPYTEAAIFEAIRLSGVVPLGLPHCATEDVNVNGHVIKKGTLVFFNMYSVGHGSQWENSQEFNPGRFLNQDGKLINDRVDNVLAFSAGRRRCPGELLARNELFILFATVLLRCVIKKPEGTEYDPEHGIYSLTYSPKPYHICVLPKEN